MLPNGDVLVAETNAPPKPDDGKGIKGWVMKQVMKRAGAGVPSANRITLLRDADGDGVAETKTVFLENLNSPFGMALVGNDLYVANSDAIVRYPVQRRPDAHRRRGQQARRSAGRADQPPLDQEHHRQPGRQASTRPSARTATSARTAWTAEEGRAAIWEIDRATGAHRVFASGLRNPNGMAWEPESGALWTVVNERDELGNDLVPDYLTSVKDGAFYGWPYSYYGQHVDERVKPQRPDLVAKAIAPDYALGAHTASLGLAFSTGTTLAGAVRGGGMFVGQHGSWNRKPRSGYKVIFVPFAGGKPSGQPIDVLTGFVNADGEAYGRPVGVAIDKAGAAARGRRRRQRRVGASGGGGRGARGRAPRGARAAPGGAQRGRRHDPRNATPSNYPSRAERSPDLYDRVERRQ